MQMRVAQSCATGFNTRLKSVQHAGHIGGGCQVGMKCCNIVLQDVLRFITHLPALLQSVIDGARLNLQKHS